MEAWDSELEQRVWRRVRGKEMQEDLSEMIRLCRRQLWALREMKTELYRQEQQALGLLTGLQTVAFGKQVPSAAGGRREATAPGRCLERCRRQLELYVAMENHSRFGPVFTALARQKRAQCAHLQQLAAGRG